jgi:hypothetical protein
MGGKRMGTLRKMLKKIGIMGLALMSMILIKTSKAHALTMVGSSTFTVGATVTGVSTVTATLKLITTNVVVPGGSFTTLASSKSWDSEADQYVDLTVNDNAISWRMRTYTNNFSTSSSFYSPSTATWGLQYGGLVSTNTAGGKASMGWQASTSTVAGGYNINRTTSTGNPADPLTGWTFYKDAQDDWAVSFATDAAKFYNADATGYTNIAFGGNGSTNIVEPLVTGGSVTLPKATQDFFLYWDADFSTAGAASYKATVLVELINN